MSPKRKWEKPDPDSDAQANECLGAWAGYQVAHAKSNKMVVAGKWFMRLILYFFFGWQTFQNQTAEKIELYEPSSSVSIFSETAYAGERYVPDSSGTWIAVVMKYPKNVVLLRHRTGLEKPVILPLDKWEDEAYGEKK